MAPVWQNEGTNVGTVAILDNYEEVQCGHSPESQRWSSDLTLWHGDVKTILRLRSVQDMRMLTAERPYDQKVWVMPVLGLWHLRYNFLKLIHKIHWGGSQPLDSSCLQYAADAWNRTNVNTPNDFQKLEELLLHSYQARVLGLLLAKAGRLLTRREEAEAWLNSLSSDEMERRLSQVFDSINPIGFDDQDRPAAQNQVFFNHQCFMRHMDIYISLRYAIKFADIELLRSMLRETCILFQAKQGHCDNYGPELLRLLHTCDSPAASSNLKKAILANSLVNLQAAPGKWFEVDRLVEFVNALVATSKRDRLSSTKPLEELLKQITLTAPYHFDLKIKLEGYFGRKYSGEHPPKEASEDIWTMAMDLSTRDFKDIQKEEFSAYLAINLKSEGYKDLAENITRYNQRLATGLTLDNDDINVEEDNNSLDNTNQPVVLPDLDSQIEGLLADIA